jgi:hypothetical protein
VACAGLNKWSKKISILVIMGSIDQLFCPNDSNKKKSFALVGREILPHIVNFNGNHKKSYFVQLSCTHKIFTSFSLACKLFACMKFLACMKNAL